MIYGDESEVACWGKNSFGQLGVASSGTSDGFGSSSKTAKFWGGSKFSIISSGKNSTCGTLDIGIESTNEWYTACCGVADNLRLGTSTGTNISPFPVGISSDPVFNLEGEIIEVIRGGFDHFCTIAGDLNSVFCWGSNSNLQSGGDSTDESVLVSDGKRSPPLLSIKLKRWFR